MAGRSYRIENGTKTLLPTERQLARMEEIKQRTFVDIRGYNENSLFSDKAQREHLLDWAKAQDPAYLAKLIREGKITEDYIKAMWLRNYLDRKKGFMPNDLLNPDSRWNLKSLEDIFHVQAVEHGALWDKFGTFIGYTTGTSSEVTLGFGEGMLTGGTILHNHPTQKMDALGGGFSVYQETDKKGKFAGDFITFKNSGAGRMIAAGIEGSYELTAPRSPTYSMKDLKILQSEAEEIRRKTWDKYKSVRGAFSTGLYARANAISHFEALKDFARRHGCSYTFRPNKGYEDLLEPSALTKPLIRNK